MKVMIVAVMAADVKYDDGSTDVVVQPVVIIANPKLSNKAIDQLLYRQCTLSGDNIRIISWMQVEQTLIDACASGK